MGNWERSKVLMFCWYSNDSMLARNGFGLAVQFALFCAKEECCGLRLQSFWAQLLKRILEKKGGRRVGLQPTEI